MEYMDDSLKTLAMLSFKRRYKLLDEKIYSLIAIPLFISIIGLIYFMALSISAIVTSQEEIPEESLAYAMAFIGFGAVYVVGSSAIAYILYNTLHDHLFYSVSETLLSTIDSDDTRILGYLLRPGYTRSKIPSPITALLLTLLTGGIAFPVLLYIFEKRIRLHDMVESRVKGVKPLKEIDIGNLLLDLVLLFITMGLWLGVWIWRAISTYNRHVKARHLYKKVSDTPVFTPSPLLSIPLTLLTISTLTFLSLMKLPVVPLPQLIIGFLMAYTAYVMRRTSFINQVAVLTALQYIVLGAIGLIGYLTYHIYYPMLEGFEELQEMMGRDLPSLVFMIYQNNLRITLLGLIPFLGPVIMGYAIGNTSFLFGLIVYRKPDALTLFIMPHTFLEFLTYALAVSIATRIPVEGRRLLPYVVIALLILFLGAVVESLLIVMGR